MIANIVFTPTSDADAARGMLAFVRCDYGPLRIDGVVLRRTEDQRLVLSWPERRDRQGRAHPIVRPLNDGARQHLEAAVLVELKRQEAAR